MCKMCWEHWQFTSVQRTQKLFLCMCKINLSKPYCFSAYMSGSSSPSTSSATTIYQLSSLPPPSTLSDASIDTDLLKPPGEHRGTCYRLWQQPHQQQICVRAVIVIKSSSLAPADKWAVNTVNSENRRDKCPAVAGDAAVLCSVCAVLEIVCWWLTQIDWVDERCVAAGGNLAASRPATAPTPARTNHLSPTTLFTVNSYHLWNDFYELSVFSEYEKIVCGLWIGLSVHDELLWIWHREHSLNIRLH